MKAKPFYLRDLPWKLVAVGAASVLWLVTVGEANVTTSVTVPLQLLNTPPNLEVSSTLPSQIRLDIRGRSGRMTPADLSAVAVMMDLSEARPGDRILPIDTSNVTLPPGVSLERAEPRELEFRLEPRARKTVPITARIAAQPSSDWEVTGLEINPKEITIAGPESHLAGIANAETEPLDLSAIQTGAEIQTHALVPDATIRFESTSRVKVRVRLRKK